MGDREWKAITWVRDCNRRSVFSRPAEEVLENSRGEIVMVRY